MNDSKARRAARAVHRVLLNTFNGMKVAMDIPIVAGLTAGLTAFLWLSVLLPGGALR